MAGTVTITRETRRSGKAGKQKRTIEVVTIDWVADAAAATVPDTSMELRGRVLKAVTNPGATAPTDNYDMILGDPDDTAFDAMGGALANRDTANTEHVYPVVESNVTGIGFPVYLNGTYLFKLSNNSVNSATGRLVLYLED